jgi:hypothetical protein
MTDALLSGAAGAAGLTLLHETVRRAVPDAPRMDLLGERSIAAGLRAVGAKPPPEPHLHTAALVGDLVSNTAYYALVGLGGRDEAVARGGLLGLTAGLGAVLLPGPLGLGNRPSGRTPQTAAMTVAWYTVGGLIAGAVYRCLLADPTSGQPTDTSTT